MVPLRSISCRWATPYRYEIISNESQERMGIAMRMDDVEILKKVSERECAHVPGGGGIGRNMELKVCQQQEKRPCPLT